MRHDQRDEFGWRSQNSRTLDSSGKELEPEKAVPLQGQQIRQFANRRKSAAAEQLDRLATAPFREVEFNGLRRTRQVGDAQDDLVSVSADVRNHLAICRVEKLQCAAA